MKEDGKIAFKSNGILGVKQFKKDQLIVTLR